MHQQTDVFSSRLEQIARYFFFLLPSATTSGGDAWIWKGVEVCPFYKSEIHTCHNAVA